MVLCGVMLCCVVFCSLAGSAGGKSDGVTLGRSVIPALQEAQAGGLL